MYVWQKCCSSNEAGSIALLGIGSSSSVAALPCRNVTVIAMQHIEDTVQVVWWAFIEEAHRRAAEEQHSILVARDSKTNIADQQASRSVFRLPMPPTTPPLNVLPCDDWIVRSRAEVRGTYLICTAHLLFLQQCEWTCAPQQER